MKPATEPIILFQRPYQGKPVECIAKTGAGALNIEAARIGDELLSATRRGVSRIGTFEGADGNETPERIGRWPANFVLTTEAAKRLKTEGEYFHTYDWSLEIEEQLANADPVHYEAKASTSEREAGLDHLLPRKVNDGRQTPIDNPYQRGETERLNEHPTVKPIGLTEWLAKLLLPPKEYGPRRILIPFAGSGSEMIGAYRAGWEYVYGIEMSMQYAAIARARLHYWRMQGVQLPLFDAA